LQAKLLRVLQEGEFFRIGGERPIKINVRVICATNTDLPQAIAEKRFREDLFYRLQAAQIKLAPLRERKGDIPLLVEHFLKKYNDQEDTNITGYSKKALELLKAYSWPGNIRELENVIWNAVVMRKRGNIQPDDLDLAAISAVTDKIEISISTGKIEFQEFMKTATQAIARQLVKLTLIKCNSDTTMAREMLGLKRWDNITRKYGINLKELAQDYPTNQEPTPIPLLPENPPELNTRQKTAIQHLKTNPTITAEEYGQLTQTSHRTALREIKKLLGLGLITKTGAGYYTSYRLSN
jgi:DNA-binding NtrC family response regulator